MSRQPGDEEGPIRRGLTLQVIYDAGRRLIRIANKGQQPVRVGRLRLEYTLAVLHYDRREACKDRRVVEDIEVDAEVLPNAEMTLKLRDVENVERVCIGVGDSLECYQPVRVGEENRR